MKKSLSIILIYALVAVLVLISVGNVFAATVLEIDGYILHVEDDGTTRLAGWNGGNINLVVPFSVRDNYISEIEDFAFSENDKILSLDMNNAYYMTRIGINAFKGCTNLSGKITLPSRVRNIGTGAFQECTSIQEVIVHAGPSKIPSQLFYGCTSLKSVFMSSGITSIDRLAFAECTELESITIPNSVSEIDSSAFYNDGNLVIKCYRNSYAMQYAIDNGINYEILDPLIGDVNGDDEITIMDATIIQKKSLGIATADVVSNYDVVADVNRDGIVNIRDVTLIQMYVAGIITEF